MNWRTVKIGLISAAAVTVAAQIATAATLIAVDTLRERRQPPSGDFPREAPRTTQTHGSAMTVYTDGDALYDAMLADIRAAKDTIFFESYIWKKDPMGERFKEELTEAALRGVDVYVIYDRFANLVVPPNFKRFHPALNVLPFKMFNGTFPLALRTYARDHRKLLVVDERVGYVGGYNIGQIYADSWRDTHLRIEGPAVWELANAFVDFWNFYKKKHQPALADRGARRWDASIRAALNLPHRMLFPIRGIYIDAIDRATESVSITQAYFLPDEDIVHALLSAVKRGVDVHVLVPELSNHVVADWVSRAGYERLLAGGVHLHRYQHAMVHAKTMTVDGRWSTVGTTNIDRLSFTGNFEINLEIFDDALAHAMEGVFATDLTNAVELTLEEWRSRPWWKTAVERLLAPLSPLL